MLRDEGERKRGILMKDVQELLSVKWRRQSMVGESGRGRRGLEM